MPPLHQGRPSRTRWLMGGGRTHRRELHLQQRPRRDIRDSERHGTRPTGRPRKRTLILLRHQTSRRTKDQQLRVRRTQSRRRPRRGQHHRVRQSLGARDRRSRRRKLRHRARRDDSSPQTGANLIHPPPHLATGSPGSARRCTQKRHLPPHPSRSARSRKRRPGGGEARWSSWRAFVSVIAYTSIVAATTTREAGCYSAVDRVALHP
jgi:hypothetical protein